MAKTFTLPDLGEGIHEGEVLTVFVAAGDAVAEGDTLMEVETDKAAVELPSPVTGTIDTIAVAAGDTVHVGDTLVVFADGDGAVAEKSTPTDARAPLPAPPAPTMSSQPPQPTTGGPVPAAPSTRRLARELGVDLGHVSPTGPAGLVTAEDVRRHAAAPTPAVGDATAPEPYAGPPKPLDTAAPALPDFAQWGPVERRPLSHLRRTIARHMALSWSQIPHVTSQDDIDITELDALRRRHKKRIAEQGGKLTVTVFALKAAVAALKAYPDANASLDPASGELIRKHYYHLGVAVDTDDGLIVPVIRDVDKKSIEDLSIELTDLAERTRQRKATIAEMQGGTFTLTNIGSIGGGHFAPIINYPQVAIMGFGRARWQPAVVDMDDGRRQIVPRLILPFVLSADHRVMDGGTISRFMASIRAMLEDPGSLLMKMA